MYYICHHVYHISMYLLIFINLIYTNFNSFFILDNFLRVAIHLGLCATTGFD